jgi:DnaJ-domain-containing protein 1
MIGKSHYRVRGVKCGKCERIHAWYKYRVWREEGRIKEEYLGKCDRFGNLDRQKSTHRKQEKQYSWQEQFRSWQEERQKSKHNKSPYQVLGIPKSATRAQIKAAYRRLVKLFHPDTNPHIDPTIIIDIYNAYRTLTQ